MPAIPTSAVAQIIVQSPSAILSLRGPWRAAGLLRSGAVDGVQWVAPLLTQVGKPCLIVGPKGGDRRSKTAAASNDPKPPTPRRFQDCFQRRASSANRKSLGQRE